MHDLNSRLNRCFHSVFPDLAAEQVPTASVESVRGWDSLAAVTLLAVVQAHLGVRDHFGVSSHSFVSLNEGRIMKAPPSADWTETELSL